MTHTQSIFVTRARDTYAGAARGRMSAFPRVARRARNRNGRRGPPLSYWPAISDGWRWNVSVCFICATADADWPDAA
ncbi:unnamed protein product, partial [Iphiclides podalirius]